jgi:hypothetical protein
MRGHRRDIAPAKDDRSAPGRKHARYRSQCGGLSRTIRSDQGDNFTGLDA